MQFVVGDWILPSLRKARIDLKPHRWIWSKPKPRAWEKLLNPTFYFYFGNQGYQSLCSAEAVLFHHESLSRNVLHADEKDPHPLDTTVFRDRYRHDIGRDPFYPAMLSRLVTQYRPMRVPYSYTKISYQISENVKPKPLTTP